ncbi:hypothetical protein [Halostagnicola kamekurae]|uniref:Uncharacterized protein n=1 Tax=Halostagnicola kamekurae TaxID=619731 RepID=A0A1I6SPZ0_9EURY|nr:hypothetical protein [Halostagnicola kamekurae]SFS78848.1 hypothetical protein SAMN04488556_2826 [Halostagnicola kamekurae]
MIGTTPERDIVDWERSEDDGTTVYTIEYDAPVTEPTFQSSSLFGTSTGGPVPADDREIRFPDGETLPANELSFDAEGTTLRVRHGGESIFGRIRRVLFPWL